MTLIGENIHIISPVVKEAIINRDENFILNLVKKQTENGINTIDLNIGPAKNKLQDSMIWLVKTIQDNFDVNISLDTTNFKELEDGFSVVKNSEKCFLNSASSDTERLENTTNLAQKYNCNLIALTLSSKTGIPKTSDERLELAFEMVDIANSKKIENNKIYLDPLILPISAAQEQAIVSLETIRMFKESFDPEIKTVIGLSNISNGVKKENRPLVNKVFMALALGYGLDCAIIDGCDIEIIDLYNMIKNNKKRDEKNAILFDLYEMAQTFGELEDIKYNKECKREIDIIKTAQILLNKEIYSPSYLER